MIRTMIQWLIGLKVDDNASLGWFLSLIIKYDKPSRLYYENLIQLGTCLKRESYALLENSAHRPQAMPLRIVSRTVISRKNKDFQRNFIRNSLTVIALSIFFVFGFGAILAGWGFTTAPANYTEAASYSETTRNIGELIQNDPAILNELIQLCRQAPNGSGPFFMEPLE